MERCKCKFCKKVYGKHLCSDCYPKIMKIVVNLKDDFVLDKLIEKSKSDTLFLDDCDIKIRDKIMLEWKSSDKIEADNLDDKKELG